MRLAFVSAVAVALVATFAQSTSAAKPGGVKTHDVDMFWTPDAQDLDPGPVVVDSFVSEGQPFGRRLVTTETPRSQTGGAIRTGKWTVVLGNGQQVENTERCFGTFRLERNVLETTDDFQRVEYGGILKIKGCAKSKEFKKVQPGKLGELRGETLCTLRRCKGTLVIEGSIRY